MISYSYLAATTAALLCQRFWFIEYNRGAKEVNKKIKYNRAYIYSVCLIHNSIVQVPMWYTLVDCASFFNLFDNSSLCKVINNPKAFCPPSSRRKRKIVLRWLEWREVLSSTVLSHLFLWQVFVIIKKINEKQIPRKVKIIILSVNRMKKNAVAYRYLDTRSLDILSLLSLCLTQRMTSIAMRMECAMCIASK